MDKIRSALSQKIKGDIACRISRAANEVIIGTELEEERQLNINRQAMADVLTATFGQPGSGKLDFNNASTADLVYRLRDPWRAPAWR